MKNYYTTIGSKESDDLQTIKTSYYALAMQAHPDRGGSEIEMKILNNAWEWIRANHGNFTAEERNHIRYDVSKDLIDLAVSVINQSELIDATIAGAWIWITGPKLAFTKDLRTDIKEKGFKFSKNKLAWYFAGCKSYNKGKKYSLDQIYNTYGSYKVNDTAQSSNLLK